MDKLIEIMEWKRREIADRIRPVRDQELAHFKELNLARKGFVNSLAGTEQLFNVGDSGQANVDLPMQTHVHTETPKCSPSAASMISPAILRVPVHG